MKKSQTRWADDHLRDYQIETPPAPLVPFENCFLCGVRLGRHSKGYAACLRCRRRFKKRAVQVAPFQTQQP